MTCELLEESPTLFNYTFKAVFNREGHATEEMISDQGSLTIDRGQNSTHRRLRGSSRLGTCINWVCLNLELETVNGMFRLDVRASKVRRAFRNEEIISMNRSANFF